MFQPAAPLIEIVIRTAVVYLGLLIGLRLAGKREIGQMNTFDLVVLLLIANAVQNAMVGADNSLTGGLLAAVVLLILNSLLAWLRLRIPALRRWVEGTPTLLVMKGKVLEASLRREGLDTETLEAALREHGIINLSEVEVAYLEIDGMISVVPVGNHVKKIKSPRSFRV